MSAYSDTTVIWFYWSPRPNRHTGWALASPQPVGSRMWNEVTAQLLIPDERQTSSCKPTVQHLRFLKENPCHCNSSLTSFSMSAGRSLISASPLLSRVTQNLVKPIQHPSTAPWWKRTRFSMGNHPFDGYGSAMVVLCFQNSPSGDI